MTIYKLTTKTEVFRIKLKANMKNLFQYNKMAFQQNYAAMYSGKI